jgi:HJR/Mrr/RecB family endonuclease
MGFLRFNGVLEEIIEKYPNLDLIDFLQKKLQLPDYKAEELASRIEKEYLHKTVNRTEPKLVRTVLEKPNKSEIALKTCIYSLDSLSEKEFEYFIKWLLEEMGYEIQQEKDVHDSGIDLIALKDHERIVVQVKKYHGSCNVSDTIVLLSQEATRRYCCSRAIVITTAYFTRQAKEDAKKVGIELWDKDILSEKIVEVTKNADLEVQSRFPQFKGSLLQSLLTLDKTKDFIIDPRTSGRYDLYLPRVKFPLLTFQANSDDVIRCVFRIKSNKPVGESEGTALINCDQDNNRLGPNDAQAYALIIQYLEEFLE